PTISFGSPPRFIARRGACSFRDDFMSHPFDMSVRNGPATMQLTRTFGPYANANDRVIELSPAFAAPYGSDVGDGFSDAVLEMLMIEPPSPFAIRLPTSADRRNGPLKFSPTTLSNRSSEMSSSTGYSGDMPALLTSTSTRPNRSYAASASLPTSSQRPT